MWQLNCPFFLQHFSNDVSCIRSWRRNSIDETTSSCSLPIFSIYKFHTVSGSFTHWINLIFCFHLFLYHVKIDPSLIFSWFGHQSTCFFLLSTLFIKMGSCNIFRAELNYNGLKKLQVYVCKEKPIRHQAVHSLVK
jgi:hypothetical protein